MSKAKKILLKNNQIEEIHECSLLVTLDVKSLYTNIPNNEVIKTVKKAYKLMINALAKLLQQKLSQLSSV